MESLMFNDLEWSVRGGMRWSSGSISFVLLHAKDLSGSATFGKLELVMIGWSNTLSE